MSEATTKPEGTSFESFAQLCEKSGLLSKPAGLSPEDVCDGFTDEVTLRRFFVGRGGDVEGAVQQFTESVETRKAIGDIETYETIEVNHYEATRKMYPHWTGCRDKRGLPICMFDVAHLDRAAMAEYRRTRDMKTTKGQNAEPSATQRAFAFHDTMTRFILPLCSAMQDRPNPETPISSAVYLVDVASFGIKQALDVRSYAQDISKLLAISFPEVVDTVFVLNAPSYFSKIWGFLKKWVDPRTASKLVIVTSDQVLSTLTSSIDPAHIPKQFGGQYTFEHGMLPIVDEALCQRVEWLSGVKGTLPPGPIKWTTDSQGKRTAVAVGTVDGEPRRTPVAILKL